MKVSLSNFRQITIDLKTPFQVGDFLLNRSRSFQFDAIIGDEKFTGEIPSLELFYPNDSLEGLDNFSFQLKEEEIDFTKPFFNQKIPLENPAINMVFAIEQLLLTYLESHKKKTPLTNLKSEAKINSLLTHSNETNFLENPNELSSVVKVKIGRKNNNEKERELIHSLIAQGKTLRLDGNRMCHPSQLEELLGQVDQSKIEYIEEPFASLAEWEKFKLRDKFALAIDESFEACMKEKKFPSETTTLIIKPSLVLSLSGIFAAKKNHLINNFNLVISSSFEAPQSFNTLVSLGAFTEGYHGLGTMEHLKTKQNLFKRKGDFLQGFSLMHFQL